MSCLRPSPPSCGASSQCIDTFGCPPNVCPDFTIRRHDTMPVFKVSVEDDTGAMNLTDLVLEASMWATARLKKTISEDDVFLSFVDNVGYEQILENDIIVTDRVRSPEMMQVVGFDESTREVNVVRGYQDTTPSEWCKGTGLRIFRFRNAAASTEMLVDDIEQADGSTLCNQLIESFLVYEWLPNDTCVPGCYWLEFKLLKMGTPTPSVTPLPGCSAGLGVEWVRRFPVCGEGFLIKICESPTFEI